MTSLNRRGTAALVLTLALGLGVAAEPARAEPCTFARFSPGAFQAFLLDSLPGLGLTVVPPGFTVEDEGALVGGLSGDLTFVARGEEVVAVMAYRSDPFTQEERLTVIAASGELILSVVQGRVSCGPATCYEIVYDTAWDLGGGGSPFVVTWGPFGGTDYEFVGFPVGPALFRSQFSQSIEWTLDLLDVLPGLYRVRLPAPIDRLRYAVLSDPWISPSTELFSISGQRPYALVEGSVPSNAIYGRIVDHALELGFWGINPDLIIDTRLQEVRTEVPPYSCAPSYPVWSWPPSSWWPAGPAWSGWWWWAGWPAEHYAF